MSGEPTFVLESTGEDVGTEEWATELARRKNVLCIVLPGAASSEETL